MYTEASDANTLKFKFKVSGHHLRHFATADVAGAILVR